MSVIKQLCWPLLLLSVSINSHASVIPLFTEEGITQWQHQVFSDTTHYQPIQDQSNWVLQAKTDRSASGLYFEKQIDIQPGTRLEWRWKISNILSNIDETSKQGDDYPVRVYVVVSDGPFFWQKRTLVYVWSSNQPSGSRWPNAYTDNAVMWALNSGTEQLSQWVSHSRDLYQDLETAFGKSYQQIEAIAIMSDTDNSGQATTAWYDHIYLK